MVNGNQPYTLAACRKLTAEERKISAETLAGAACRKISLNGLNDKVKCLEQMLIREQARTKPDVALIKRIQCKIAEIKSTLEHCKTR
ncbi:MAG: hypothetical protein IKW57_04625 [Alphaproteobacteria bacterium]|nr:hypothetical protein [Alphaproteobacteria bacterium]